MSGLVGYASSSDEEEDVVPTPVPVGHADTSNAPPPGSSGPPHRSEQQGMVQDVSAASGSAVGFPMIGPTVPPNPYQDTEDAAVEELWWQSEISNMAPREAIQYLTQTTHPMTSMPPSPPGSPDPVANAKFARFRELKAKGFHFNQDLASKSAFRNPGLLTNMMRRAGVGEDEQYNTTLPKHLWNPAGFPGSGYKEELLKSQQLLRERDEAEKKALSAAGKRVIEFQPAKVSAPSSRHSTPGKGVHLRTA